MLAANHQTGHRHRRAASSRPSASAGGWPASTPPTSTGASSRWRDRSASPSTRCTTSPARSTTPSTRRPRATRAPRWRSRAAACTARWPASPTTRSPPSWRARWPRIASPPASSRRSSTASSATSPRRATRAGTSSPATAAWWRRPSGGCACASSASTTRWRCEHADDLGLAMQLTNILRDVRGDLELGRVYLPADELAAHGISEQDLADGRATPRVARVRRLPGAACPAASSPPGCAWSGTSPSAPGSACAPWPASTRRSSARSSSTRGCPCSGGCR